MRAFETNSGNSRPVTSSGSARPAGERAVPPTHVVQFCDDDRALTASAASFLAEGIAAGEPAVAFATPARREAMRDCLRDRGLDVNYLERQSRLTVLDARATLATFMCDDMPDAHKFSHSVGAAIERLCAANAGSPIRAFGEMVSLLWQDGNTRAAVRLEELWNDLAAILPISLLCSYAGGEFLTATGDEDRERICRLHTHILDTGSQLVADSTLPAYRSLTARTLALEKQLEDRTALEARLKDALAARKVAEEELQRAAVERERLLQREREARAEAESANRAKAEFLSVMSHELRTPLNAIGGHVQLIELELHGPVTSAQRDALTRIAKSQRHLLMLVNDVLNLARIETGQMEYAVEELDLETAARQVVGAMQPLFERSELTCHVQPASADVAPLVVSADGEKVRQILINLLTNAIKFTRSGGCVTVSVGPSPRNPSHVAVTVSDTGLGIALVRLRHVFEPFGQEPRSTTHHLDGTGLSLAISRDLARGMGGELSAESVPGEGSTFIFDLPRAVAAPIVADPPVSTRTRRAAPEGDSVQPAAKS